VLAWTRKKLRPLILRGPVLDRWVARRGRQWDRAYLAHLAQSFSYPAPPETPPIIPATGTLRHILLIADCMWEQNDLVPEFARIAETRLLDLRPALKKKPEDQSLAEAVVQAVRQFADGQGQWSPDVILFYARPLLLSEEVFHVLRRRWKCPLLGMNLDDKLQFFSCGIFSASGVHRPLGLTEPTSAGFKYEFGFLGSIKPERKTMIEQLRHAGVSISLFGAGWPNTQWVDDPNAVFRSTQINLGIGFATPSLTLTTVKGRDFECPGVGACYLTTYNWELPLHYELGKEILCYRSVEELIEIYAYYRRRPEDCLKIAQAAWRRCAAEHTWEKRFRRIFRHVGFEV
jgi:hypothetical protein